MKQMFSDIDYQTVQDCDPQEMKQMRWSLQLTDALTKSN